MIHYRGIELDYATRIERLPSGLREVFIELAPDDSTRAWIDAAFARPDPLARRAFRLLASLFLNFYDAFGLANVGQDRLLSTAQWQRLLGRGGTRLLDVGAGEGSVTRELAALYSETVTTELSTQMARRLREKGFVCHARDLSSGALDDLGRFDLVALQNVIDRTTHPLRLLARAGQLLADGGRLVVAVPVPLRPVAFIGPSRFHPAERLPMEAADFESAVAALDAQVFTPLGYRVLALTRAPYLARGGPRSPVHSLDDAIFVLARDQQTPAS